MASTAGAVVDGQEAAALQQTPETPNLDVLSSTRGQPRSGGRFFLESNAKLFDVRTRMQQFELMLRTDGVIGAVTDASRHLLLSARMGFERQDGGSQEIADYCNEALGVGDKVGVGRMSEDFESAEAKLLTYRDMGFAYAEEVYKVEDGLVWLDRYAEMRQAAHWQWITDEHGEFAGVRQVDPSGSSLSTFGTVAHVPAHKMLLLTHRGNSNFEGVGLLRGAWFSWRVKTMLLDMMAIAAERWAVATPILVIDPEALQKVESIVWSQTTTKEAVDKLTAMLEDYVSHDKAYMVTYKGLEVSKYGGDMEPERIIPLIRHCNQELLVNWNAPHLGLGTWSEAGSRALGDSQTGAFRAQLANSIEYLAARIGGRAGPGRGTIGRLIGWNFGNISAKDWPQFRSEGVDEDKLLRELGKLPGLVDRGLLTPTTDIEQQLRRLVRMRPLAPSDERTPQERLATPEVQRTVTTTVDGGEGPGEPVPDVEEVDA